MSYDPQSASYYERLGVPEDATDEQITAAYKSLRKQMHPDNKAEATKAYYDGLMARLNEARDGLLDLKQRAKHDARLRQQEEPPDAGEEEGEKTYYEEGYADEGYHEQEDEADAWEEWEGGHEQQYRPEYAPPGEQGQRRSFGVGEGLGQLVGQILAHGLRFGIVKLAALGAGAFVVIILFLGCVGAVLDSFSPSDSQASNPPSQQQNQNQGQGQSQNQANNSGNQGSSGSSDQDQPQNQNADNVGSEADLRKAVEDYYRAADQMDWSYTLDHLDHQTRSSFTTDEWNRKNQYLADETADLSSIDVQDKMPSSGNVADVTVNRAFADGTTQTRQTRFVYEDGTWKHRFTREERSLFEPGVDYDQWVQDQKEAGS